MAVKTVCYFSTLMKYAYELGQARLTGNPALIEAAERDHNWYRDLCLQADEMVY